MSYTMTIESPEKAAWFEARYSKLSQEQLGALFVSLLMQTKYETSEKVGDFSRFAGRWSAEETRVFDKAITRAIDDEESQRNAILAAAGGWQDTRTENEIIADIEAHRTPGREVVI